MADRRAVGEDLGPALERLAGLPADPRAGIFGPGSLVWEINRQTAIFLGAGRAALLQLAHPFVAQAIADHSDATRDPIGRFHRTFTAVFDMVYGDREGAFAAARRVHAIHRRIHGRLDEGLGGHPVGTGYTARDVGALCWVHATLWDTSMLVHERLQGRESAERRDRYYAETLRFAALFGIPEDALPGDWAGFERFVGERLRGPELCVGRAAREIADLLFQPPRPGLGPAMRAYRRLTATLVPEPLRSGFGLGHVADDDPTAARLFATAGGLLARMPASLRHLPPYHEARARLAGRSVPPVARLLRRAFVGARTGR